MDRSVPYEDDTICDQCGHKGAYDCMGDYFCEDCLIESVGGVLTEPTTPDDVKIVKEYLDKVIKKNKGEINHP